MGLDMGGHGCRARTTGRTGSRLPPSAHGRPSTVRRPTIVVAGGHALALQLAMLASLPSASSSSSKEDDDVR